MTGDMVKLLVVGRVAIKSGGAIRPAGTRFECSMELAEELIAGGYAGVATTAPLSELLEGLTVPQLRSCLKAHVPAGELRDARKEQLVRLALAASDRIDIAGQRGASK